MDTTKHNNEHNIEIVPDPINKAHHKKIWQVTGILAIVTIIELILAFTLPFGSAIKVILFVLMTFFKSYYIVSEFMHLGHEKKGLVYAILLPTVLIAWLLLALYLEGVFRWLS